MDARPRPLHARSDAAARATARVVRRPAWAASALALAAALALATPVAAHADIRFPVQSLGDRGTDVLAIQYLLRATGRAVPVDGRLAASTAVAVADFQASKGLAPTGIVDATTWSRLGPRLVSGSRGDAVRALQVELNGKRRAGLVVDGVLDSPDRAALIAFQRHMGMATDGIVQAAEWRYLAWHYETPRFASGRLCDYSVGNGPANWGTAELQAVLRTASIAVAKAGYGPVAVGDASLEHGGDIAGHDTHEVGLDVDLRLMRRDEGQCTLRSNYHYASYSRMATRALVQAIRAAASGHLKVIYFNDPQLIAEGLVRPYAGHDDHLHVRLCEAWHADPRYDC